MPGRIPEVSTRNGVRVYLQGSGGEELFRFGCGSLPREDEVIVYQPVDGDAVQYKVEKVYYAIMEQPASVNVGPNPDNMDPYTSYVRIQVSEVV